MELGIELERTDDTCVVSLSGEVDVYTSPALKERLIESVDSGCSNILVDMSNVAFIDSSGLGVLVSGLRRVKERGGNMRLVCTKDSILKIFRITGLDKVFPIFSDMEEARQF